MDSDTKKRGSEPGPAAAAAPEDEERRYSNDELIASARVLLGVSPIAAEGALASSSRKTHTQEQAQALVKQFMRREVS